MQRDLMAQRWMLKLVGSMGISRRPPTFMQGNAAAAFLFAQLIRRLGARLFCQTGRRQLVVKPGRKFNTELVERMREKERDRNRERRHDNKSDAGPHKQKTQRHVGKCSPYRNGCGGSMVEPIAPVKVQRQSGTLEEMSAYRNTTTHSL